MKTKPKPTPTLTLGERIRELRMQRNMTLDALARLCDVNMMTVWRWEMRGQEPRLSVLPKLAAAFKVSVQEITNP